MWPTERPPRVCGIESWTAPPSGVVYESRWVRPAGPAGAAGASFFHPERLTRRDDDDRMMKESIEQRGRGCLHWQEVTPLFEWPVTRQAQAAVFVRGGNEAKEQLRPGFIERREPELIDE